MLKPNKMRVMAIFQINRAKKLVELKTSGVLAVSLEHSHTNDLGIILVHSASRRKFVVDNKDQITEYKY